MTSTTSTSFGSEMTETVSNSMNTEEVSDVDFTDILQRGTIVAVAPMELAFSAQLGVNRDMIIGSEKEVIMTIIYM
ncbi:uncharacterized protein LOC112552484 [Pogonomyrmex barbatus]|uniref:Uncharacterized protein LOC112552484 n=1 Tax=Pogonomyrmex barbatus TaxID=144034 RepID=A0A8N1S668_9HYME|nr:uncharacterized protein LOC112552484 [Pogonomyrmex barbatus]